jgi:hypothetical protein
MEVILLILAVHSKNQNDIPGRLELTFSSLEHCETVRQTIKYDLKFKQFILDSKCIVKY